MCQLFWWTTTYDTNEHSSPTSSTSLHANSDQVGKHKNSKTQQFLTAIEKKISRSNHLNPGDFQDFQEGVQVSVDFQDFPELRTHCKTADIQYTDKHNGSTTVMTLNGNKTMPSNIIHSIFQWVKHSHLIDESFFGNTRAIFARHNAKRHQQYSKVSTEIMRGFNTVVMTLWLNIHGKWNHLKTTIKTLAATVANKILTWKVYKNTNNK